LWNRCCAACLPTRLAGANLARKSVLAERCPEGSVWNGPRRGPRDGCSSTAGHIATNVPVAELDTARPNLPGVVIENETVARNGGPKDGRLIHVRAVEATTDPVGVQIEPPRSDASFMLNFDWAGTSDCRPPRPLL